VADGRPGGFRQGRLDVRVAVAALAGAPFPGGFVVARAQSCPGGQVGGAGEILGDAGPDLGQDCGGGQRADARDGGQQVPLGVKGRYHRLGLRVQPGDHLIEVADVIQVQAAHQGVMAAEPAFQRHRQVADLGAHFASAKSASTFPKARTARPGDQAAPEARAAGDVPGLMRRHPGRSRPPV
jgi:hypothetical protein